MLSWGQGCYEHIGLDEVVLTRVAYLDVRGIVDIQKTTVDAPGHLVQCSLAEVIIFLFLKNIEKYRFSVWT